MKRGKMRNETEFLARYIHTYISRRRARVARVSGPASVTGCRIDGNNASTPASSSSVRRSALPLPSAGLQHCHGASYARAARRFRTSLPTARNSSLAEERAMFSMER